MKIDKTQRDFATRSIQIYYTPACCTTTCCLTIIGGLLGAGIGALISGSTVKATLNIPEKDAMLRTARTWFWTGLLLSPMLTLLILNIWIASFELLLIATPALNIVFASLLTAVAIINKVPDNALRHFINYRNFIISLGAIIGNIAGWKIMMIFLH